MISAAVVFALAFTACSDDDDDNNNLTCEDAASATLEAAIAFNGSTSANYAELCADYKAALEAQIDVCGDADGDLQAVIDDLGDCTLRNDRHTFNEFRFGSVIFRRNYRYDNWQYTARTRG